MRAVTWPSPQSAFTDALEKLYRQHHEMILRTAYRLTRNMGDAEDVLHGVFVKLLQREEPFEEEANLGPYLHRAAVHAAIDILRRRKHTLPLEAVPPGGEIPEGRSASGVSREDLAERLRMALAGLPERSAEIFVLRHVEGYSNQEVARLLGISWGSVAVIVHRARRRLQKELQTERRAMS